MKKMSQHENEKDKDNKVNIKSWPTCFIFSSFLVAMELNRDDWQEILKNFELTSDFDYGSEPVK